MLGIVRLLKIVDNGADYSIHSTAQQALYLPTSREVKYKAKATIDTFFYRMSDVVQAGLVYGGTVLGFALPAFAGLNVGFALLWFLTASALARE